MFLEVRTVCREISLWCIFLYKYIDIFSNIQHCLVYVSVMDDLYKVSPNDLVPRCGFQ